jgi:hypothetical protein
LLVERRKPRAPCSMIRRKFGMTMPRRGSEPVSVSRTVKVAPSRPMNKVRVVNLWHPYFWVWPISAM